MLYRVHHNKPTNLLTVMFVSLLQSLINKFRWLSNYTAIPVANFFLNLLGSMEFVNMLISGLVSELMKYIGYVLGLSILPAALYYLLGYYGLTAGVLISILTALREIRNKPVISYDERFEKFEDPVSIELKAEK